MTDIIKHSYNGAIISQEPDGYVSLTDMAKISGKKVNDYLRLGSSKAYFEGLSGSTGIPVDKLIRVNESSGKNENRGTWAHPEIAIDFAQWCSVPFRIWANSVLRGVISHPKTQQTTAPFWYQRLILDQKNNKVPNGYFSIFREVVPLLSELEGAGYIVPDNTIPDISVGKHWANYLRTTNIIVEQVARSYPHTYPDHRGTQPCNCYPESMLPTFRQWFREKYKVDHLRKYMRSKDKSALPAIEKIVKALSAAV